jgi:hypothetical protein
MQLQKYKIIKIPSVYRVYVKTSFEEFQQIKNNYNKWLTGY